MAAMSRTPATGVLVFEGEWDDAGVFVYQAFNDTIADYAVKHQRFGGPAFNVKRMTWIKPSFAWVLYRSGYGHKHNQNRILKVKIPHESLAQILGRCQCRHGGGGSKGRVQWDPARDILTADGNEPRKMLRRRAIQIGISDELSEHYVNSILSIEDVTELAHAVCEAHQSKTVSHTQMRMTELLPRLPVERDYMPRCPFDVLQNLGMHHGSTAQEVARIGRGKYALD